MALPGRAGKSTRRRSRRLLWVGAGGAVVVVAVVAVLALGLLGGSRPVHTLITPAKLGTYVREPQLEQQMDAKALQQQVIAKSSGQASHVVYAVYEDKAGGVGGTSPLILFIGGNLSGISPSGFITSFTTQFKGAQNTSAGSMGGQAACVNAQANVTGSITLCLWADNDTFGVVASPTMSVAQLAAQMRTIRPLVERVAK